jgi:beta-N-acetylhexosaminidase
MVIRVGRTPDLGSEVGLGNADHLIDATLMLAFEGTEVPEHVRSLLRERDVAGFTLFRSANVKDPTQIRALTADLQRARHGEPPLLLAADQEGGQLIGLGDGTTQFPGNMALGAADHPALAERVGRAMGREMRALGLNVNYAPVCDLATNPDNPSLGIRSFGDDPARAAGLVGAMVHGLQAEGVAAALKHFPGMGEGRADSHYELPLVDLDLSRLQAVELVPFQAGFGAGARLVMIGHLALPSITGDPGLPSSLSPDVIRLARRDLGFEGVVITDALDMAALTQGPDQAVDAIAAIRAGVDLLLCAGDEAQQERLRSALRLAATRGLLVRTELSRSAERVAALRGWLAGFEEPGLDVLRCTEHERLAVEVAERSVTLVRDEGGLVPIRLRPGARIAAIMPNPRDLTPADTSSTVMPGLAEAMRRRFADVDGFITAFPPTPQEIGDLRARVAAYDLAVIGTIDAWRFPEQSALVAELLNTGVPAIALALRTPHDLVAYPQVSTYVCTYGVLRPCLDAAVAALAGTIPFGGRLPAAIPGLYATNHGLFS